MRFIGPLWEIKTECFPLFIAEEACQVSFVRSIWWSFVKAFGSVEEREDGFGLKDSSWNPEFSAPGWILLEDAFWIPARAF